jgi:hypothetical protein
MRRTKKKDKVLEILASGLGVREILNKKAKK